MNEDEANAILDQANYFLKNSPFEKDKFGKRKPSARKPYLRAKFIGNRKVFFNIFKQKYLGLNKRDKARRFEAILFLREILQKEIPQKTADAYVYVTTRNRKSFIIVIKDISRKQQNELYLFSIYPQ